MDNQPEKQPNTEQEPGPFEQTNSVVIPVRAEELRVDSQLVETGRLRVSKSVEETVQSVELPEMHEETEVYRVAVNQVIDTAPPVRHEGDTLIIPVLREEVTILKRLILVEEVHITRKPVHTYRQETVSLRQETVSVERVPSASPPTDSSAEL
ncbi:DUF2382 domain-containing protein [Rudanella paleaurantiibacter]|uniref:DUF2382 domain-containing protein n=1 Tax=Rudanella paleaurantiibacter TaxID=2614655 RepID=A0A7J5U3S3_9BACT|nr:YsnF/AvaK domain-containing protein [Rudanella paleaurantiibacter]KAB7732499.1 DUF2382 domain-containing protein [Rudanella paleaurantiibacter]